MILIDVGSVVLFEEGLKIFVLVGDKIVCFRVLD